MSCDLDTIFATSGPGDILIIKNKSGEYVVYARGSNGQFTQCEDTLTQKELCGYMCPTATAGRKFAVPIIVDTDVPDPFPEGIPLDEIRAFADLFKQESIRLLDRNLRVTPSVSSPWFVRGSNGWLREDRLPPIVRQLVPPLFRVSR